MAVVDSVILIERDKVAACAKHYVGDGGTHNGINENNTIIDLHGLMSIHMPAYYNSVLKGVSTVMVSYSSWNGVKMHANYDMVTQYLKNKLRFRVGSVLLFKFWTFNHCSHHCPRYHFPKKKKIVITYCKQSVIMCLSVQYCFTAITGSAFGNSFWLIFSILDFLGYNWEANWVQL